MPELERSTLPGIVIASGNRGKIEEFRGLLPPGVSISSATDLGIELPEETGSTFRENALLKARAVAAATGRLTIADDSGLEVDALGGDPGVHSARYAIRFGRQSGDSENIALLLRELSGVPSEHRTARFRSVVAIVRPDGVEHTVEGVVEGKIIDRPRGTDGFGYDPLFVPNGDHRTMAELSLSEKNRISHRGRAYREAARRIGDLLGSVSTTQD
jgi:XTP/dITP diphosphohydrolase